MADDNLALTVQDSDPETDFESIHDAFMESERGRWFLVEFARRNRHADTALLLAAIGRIESILLAQRAGGELPAPRQDPAASANPAAIKPDGDRESKAEVARVLAESASRLRDAIKGLHDVSWSMREQGDMRCEVIDRQAVDISQTVAAFDALRDALSSADRNDDVAPAVPMPQPQKNEAAAQPKPEWRIPPPPAEPAPARNFALAPLFESLPPTGNEKPPSEEQSAENASAETPADDPFADMLFDADAVTTDENIEHVAEEHIQSTSSAVPEGPFDSSQAKRLTRLINIFAGARAQAATEPEPEVVQDLPPVFAAESAAIEIAAPIAPPEQPKAAAEPADFLLEPWPPRVSAQQPVETPVEIPPVAEATPAVKASVAPTPTVNAAQLFPMSRPAPSDPLAPIVALSDEEKIALFS